MGRAKLNLELIRKEKSRSITFEKRKKGLAKKIYEFKTLCDVRACMIIYGPSQRSGSAPVQPEIWPPGDPEEIRQVILQYKSKSKEERMRRTTDLSDFYNDRKKKLDAELTKVRRRIGASRFPPWDPRLEALTQDQLTHLTADLDGKIQEAKERLDLLKGKHHTHYLHHHHRYGGGDHGSSSNFMDSSLIPTYQFNKTNNGGVAAAAAASMMDFSQSLLPLPMTHSLYNNNINGVVEHYDQAKPLQHYYPSIEIHPPQQAAPPPYAPPPIQQLPPLDVGYGNYGSWFGDGTGGGSSVGGGGILADGFQYPPWKATGPQYYGDQMDLMDSLNQH